MDTMTFSSTNNILDCQMESNSMPILNGGINKVFFSSLFSFEGHFVPRMLLGLDSQVPQFLSNLGMGIVKGAKML